MLHHKNKQNPKQPEKNNKRAEINETQTKKLYKESTKQKASSLKKYTRLTSPWQI
jgi:hypothetical protein